MRERRCVCDRMDVDKARGKTEDAKQYRCNLDHSLVGDPGALEIRFQIEMARIQHSASCLEASQPPRADFDTMLLLLLLLSEPPELRFSSLMEIEALFLVRVSAGTSGAALLANITLVAQFLN